MVYNIYNVLITQQARETKYTPRAGVWVVRDIYDGLAVGKKKKIISELLQNMSLISIVQNETQIVIYVCFV